jgi:hypothetical protein
MALLGVVIVVMGIVAIVYIINNGEMNSSSTTPNINMEAPDIDMPEVQPPKAEMPDINMPKVNVEAPETSALPKVDAPDLAEAPELEPAGATAQ